MMRAIVAALLLEALQGCVLNSVMQLDPGEQPAPGPYRAIAVYGLGVEGAWRYPEFAIVLDEYNPRDKRITGGCFLYNRMEAAVPTKAREVRQFAFDVPAGHYAYSGFNATRLSSGPVAFELPEGRVVYLGDFIYTDSGVELRRREGKVPLAKVAPISPPPMFLCTP
jgi:hypothetical protein